MVILFYKSTDKTQNAKRRTQNAKRRTQNAEYKMPVTHGTGSPDIYLAGAMFLPGSRYETLSIRTFVEFLSFITSSLPAARSILHAVISACRTSSRYTA